MKPNYVIRKAALTDLGGMAALLKALFVIEEDFRFDEEKQKKGLALMLSDDEKNCLLVAEAAEGVIGMCTVQILISTAEGGLAAVIEDVVVQEDYRGHGIGKALLHHAENWAMEKGVKRLQLLADLQNIKALKFYAKMNWRKTNLICLHKKAH
nr:GNAT family N-acetyltransferase [Syntrophobotulus glycolicus]